LRTLDNPVDGIRVDASQSTSRLSDAASSLLVNTSPLIFLRRPVHIRALSFIPFYLGKRECGDADSLVSEEFSPQGRLAIFPDGFAVATLTREFAATDIPEFLKHRRQYHLELLKENSPISMYLQSKQASSNDARDTICRLPKKLSYVMTVHEIENSAQEVSPIQCELMCEPSIVGITDDPSETPPVAFDAESFRPTPRMVDQLRDGIQIVTSQSARWYVGWANIIAEVLAPNLYSRAPLIQIETSLQKLWYKLYLHTLDLHGAFLANARNQGPLKDELSAVLGEYLAFLRPDPVTSTHLQQLKRALLKTSQLDENYRSLLSTCELLGYRQTDLLQGSSLSLG